jgi:hypothetical protein
MRGATTFFRPYLGERGFGGDDVSKSPDLDFIAFE